MAHPSKTAQIRLKSSGGTIALEALQTYRSYMYLRYERPNDMMIGVQLAPAEARELASQLNDLVDFMNAAGGEAA
jgi:hypothetical protein